MNDQEFDSVLDIMGQAFPSHNIEAYVGPDRECKEFQPGFDPVVWWAVFELCAMQEGETPTNLIAMLADLCYSSAQEIKDAARVLVSTELKLREETVGEE